MLLEKGPSSLGGISTSAELAIEGWAYIPSSGRESPVAMKKELCKT
jgi:hypothetical protein